MMALPNQKVAIMLKEVVKASAAGIGSPVIFRKKVSMATKMATKETVLKINNLRLGIL